MKFVKSSIDSKYNILVQNDLNINVPECKVKGKSHHAYKGPLSQVQDTKILDGMIERGSNLVELKVKPVKDNIPQANNNS